MKTFTFNTPVQPVIKTRQQARKAAKLVSKLIGLPCTGADKKRDKGWSFDVSPMQGNVQRKKAKRVIRKKAKRVINVSNGLVQA